MGDDGKHERMVRLPPDELSSLAEQVKNYLKAEYAWAVLSIISANVVVGIIAIFTAAGTWYSLSSRVDSNTEANRRQDEVVNQRQQDAASMKQYIDVRFDALRSVLDARDMTLNNKIDEINRFLRDHNSLTAPKR